MPHPFSLKRARGRDSHGIPSTGSIFCLALVIGIIAVYGQVWNLEFINYDDIGYVTQNLWVQNGLTFENISRAFTATEACNWHPLTLDMVCVVQGAQRIGWRGLIHGLEFCFDRPADRAVLRGLVLADISTDLTDIIDGMSIH